MAVVSDSWPELETLFEQIGLRSYFETFVISANLGVHKPHPRMYQTAVLVRRR
jgi:putative hydrolase of the HAD superfamily